MERELTGRLLDAEIEHVAFNRFCRAAEFDGEVRFARFGTVPPHYSTDPAAAQAVREEVFRRGWRWTLGRGKTGFLCILQRDDLVSHRAEAATEELAVCRAALAALVAGGGEPGAQE